MNEGYNYQMALDKELYQWAQEQYRQWSAAEVEWQKSHRGQLLPQEAWRQYVALVEFCWQLSPQQSEQQRARRLVEWDVYYARIQQFEKWRRTRNEEPGKAPA
ncbi:MAG: hypothetical protein AB1791_08170 [Chloroflexota bacterium]